MKIGLLISGNLGKIVFDHLANRHSIVFVMTNSKSVEIIEECKEKKIIKFHEDLQYDFRERLNDITDEF